MIHRAVLADTGPLYASVDPDDQHHIRAREEAEQIVAEGFTIAVCYPTLFESYTLISHRLNLASAHTFLTEMRLRAGVITPLADDFARACTVPSAFPDQRLSLFDTLLAVMSARVGASVWTFDSHFDVMRTDVWRKV